MNRFFFTLLLFMMCAYQQSKAQSVAIKTNVLYGALTFTPNLGAELGLSPKSTLDFGFGYNPWNRRGDEFDNKKLVHWLAQAEYRYWLCQKFNGHFFGTHILGSMFNISGHSLPLLLGKGSEGYRHQGWAAGAGISYGYQWILGRHWNLEANIGVGYARLQYDQYDCKNCGEKLADNKSRNYFGPTKTGISIIYLF